MHFYFKVLLKGLKRVDTVQRVPHNAGELRDESPEDGLAHGHPDAPRPICCLAAIVVERLLCKSMQKPIDAGDKGRDDHHHDEALPRKFPVAPHENEEEGHAGREKRHNRKGPLDDHKRFHGLFHLRGGGRHGLSSARGRRGGRDGGSRRKGRSREG